MPLPRARRHALAAVSAFAAAGLAGCAPSPAPAPAATMEAMVMAPPHLRAVDICEAATIAGGTLVAVSGILSGPQGLPVLRDPRGRDCVLRIETAPGSPVLPLRCPDATLARVTGRLWADEPLLPGARASHSLQVEEFSCR